MSPRLLKSLPLLLLLASALSPAQEEPLVAAAQSSADALRAATGADLAFVAAGLFRERAKIDASDLAANLLFPTDEIVLVDLTGTQIRQAFERSLVFYPQANSSFLYFSGGTVSFDRSAASGSRVKGISLDAGFEEGKRYKVAMPASLGAGGLGYFKVWDAKNVSGKASGTMESVLKGKRASAGAARWLSQG